MNTQLLDDQIALVTGGAGGVGTSIATALQSAGHRVVIADIDAEAAETVASSLSSGPHSAIAMAVDVSQRSSFEDLADGIERAFGRAPTIVVNNAARTQPAGLMTLTQQDFESVLLTNVNGAFFGSQVFGSRMAKAGYGRIVNLSSLAGQNGGTATGGHYAVSKGAILTATKIFARELASSGVTVNAISPGPHDLPVVHDIVPEERMEGFLANIPVRRLGDPDFLGEAVALLTSPSASFVTGACWDINGGLYLR